MLSLIKSILFIMASFLFYVILFNTEGHCCNLYGFDDYLDSSWNKNYNGLSNEAGIPWNNLSNDFKSSPYSLSTGKISFSGYYNITKKVKGPGNISFWWKKNDYFHKISTELYVAIDGKKNGTYKDPNFGWIYQPPLHFGPGEHNITWIFEINGTLAASRLPSDKAQGWIDEVKICETAGFQMSSNATSNLFGLKDKLSSQSPCIFDASSAEDLRLFINKTNCSKKLIRLKSGLYNGQILINNKNNISIELHPENKEDVIFDGMRFNYIFAIEDSDNISLKNLSMFNGMNGILFENATDCSIINNTIESFQINGISMNNTSGMNVINNTIISIHNNNNVACINMSSANDTIIKNNVINVTNNNKNHIAILINKSFDNIIYFKGRGYIVQESLHCGMRCNGSRPEFSDVIDGLPSQCRLLNNTGHNNTWSFSC